MPTPTPANLTDAAERRLVEPASAFARELRKTAAAPAATTAATTA